VIIPVLEIVDPEALLINPLVLLVIVPEIYIVPRLLLFSVPLFTIDEPEGIIIEPKFVKVSLEGIKSVILLGKVNVWEA
jgi:hypothetical protein